MEKHKVSNILKDIYHPKSNNMIMDYNKNKNYMYYPSDSSFQESFDNNQQKKESKDKTIVFVIRFIVFILILFVIYRLLHRLFYKHEDN